MSSAKPPKTTANSPVALVTGAGRRLGNHTARFLAAHGYRLALHAGQSRIEVEQTAKELSAQGAEAISLVADLRDEQATRQVIASAHEHFGRIDALVNNAAIWNAKPLEQTTAADVREHFEINTLGTFICCQAVGQIMVAQATGGAIVNVGDWAIARPYLDYAAYFAAKGSIPTLTRTFAIELGTRNPKVRVNAVLPGPVMLPKDMPQDERKQLIAATLVKREGTPADVVQAIHFLLENTYITGVCLPVDGGRTVFSGSIT